MTAPLTVGMQVRTSYGFGVVDALLTDGVRVHLPQHGLLMRCRYDDVQPVRERTPPGPTAPPTVHRAARLCRPQQAVEALRFGIVPRDALTQLTVGIDTLEPWVVSRLPAPIRKGPILSEVCGAFGTGKSHTMAAIRHIARAQGFLTARVEVDGRGISLSDPAGFLFHLWGTLNGLAEDTATPLLDLNLRAAGKGASASYAAVEPYDRVLANHQTVHYLGRRGLLEPFEERMDALMACNDQEPASGIASDMMTDLRKASVPLTESRENVSPTRLVGRAVDERPKDFVDCLFGYSALAKAAGYAGLVVTVDEFEVEHIATMSQAERFVQVVTTLAHRIRLSQSSAEPLAIFIATVGTDGHIGDRIVASMLSATGTHSQNSRRVLRRWPRRNLLNLARRIHVLYRGTYQLSDDFDESEAEDLAEALTADGTEAGGHIRTFIKRYVASLDQRLGPPCQ